MRRCQKRTSRSQPGASDSELEQAGVWDLAWEHESVTVSKRHRGHLILHQGPAGVGGSKEVVRKEHASGAR